MGIYDRDYFREDRSDENRRGIRRRTPRSSLSAVTWIIIINVALYFLNALLTPENNLITNSLMMKAENFGHPLYWYQILTYGFVQDPSNFMHILANMFTLFFLGPPVEQRYGRKEFLIFYLIAIIVGGLIWGFLHMGGEGAMLGASGAVSATVILFILNYPNMMLYIYGIIPVPAWLLGIGYIVYDTMGAWEGKGNIAHEVHLAGAAFALIYFFSRIRFTALGNFKKQKGKYSPRTFSVHREDPGPSNEMEAEVDRLLRKISQYGEAALTEQERETLRRASREYQKKKDR
ncbi:MAG: rhomboid family intramembrane serine protease [Planctomycetia bacterium]|nr:rhomboid family intramembrane serine protease [Planctomycetia bacterium]